MTLDNGVEAQLARVDERLKSLHDKLDAYHTVTTGNKKDIDSLKESRGKFRGIVGALMLGAGWLGIDRFFN